MAKKVLIFLVSPHKIWNLDSRYPKLLSERFPEIEVVAASDKGESLRHLPEAEILYGWSLPEKHLPLARSLKWMHIPSAGVEDSLYPALVESPIRITCSRGISSAALADHAFGMVLAFSRGLAVAIREGSSEWIRTRFFDADPMPAELDGKTLALLGFGSIGRELARRGRAFGMRVHALKRHRVEEEPLADRMFSPREMEAFLASADYLVVTLPLTSETQGILDEKRLAALKPSAVLVNIARGGLVRQDALIEALQAGRLAGAGLDVFEQEPLPADSALYGMPNVVMTPHIGGLHPNYLDRATSLFIVNLGRYLKGETLLHEVNKHAGY